jgi:hypothetical protein
MRTGPLRLKISAFIDRMNAAAVKSPAIFNAGVDLNHARPGTRGSAQGVVLPSRSSRPSPMAAALLEAGRGPT